MGLGGVTTNKGVSYTNMEFVLTLKLDNNNNTYITHWKLMLRSYCGGRLLLHMRFYGCEVFSLFSV